MADKSVSTRDLIGKIKPTVSKKRPLATPPSHPSNPTKRTKPSSRNEWGMIDPAPPPRIRTYSNSPDRPLAEEVDRGIRRRDREEDDARMIRDAQAKAKSPTPEPPNPHLKYFAKALAATYAETFVQASDSDQMLWTKNIEGVKWDVIRERWKEMTADPHIPLPPSNDPHMDTQILTGHLMYRFHMMKEAFAANGNLKFPEEYLKRQPRDVVFQTISDFNRQDMVMFEVVDEVDKELEDEKWERIRLKMEERHGKTFTTEEVRYRWEVLKNGGLDPKKINRKKKSAEELASEESGEDSPSSGEEPEFKTEDDE